MPENDIGKNSFNYFQVSLINFVFCEVLLFFCGVYETKLCSSFLDLSGKRTVCIFCKDTCIFSNG